MCLGNGQEALHQNVSDGEFFNKIDVTKGELERKLEKYKAEEVYAYIVQSVEYDGSKFLQAATGPNFEGGIITLCTCKHRMRASSRKVKEGWKSTWIAGFTGQRLFRDGRNYLFYLMRVGEAFPSQKALWDSLDTHTREVKNALHNPLGDLYQPKPSPEFKSEYEWGSYYEPCKDHDHRKDGIWKGDIDYKGLHPSLLLGEKDNSYLWFDKSRAPSYKGDGKQFRQKKFNSLEAFLRELR
ncbi:MAG: hypothetical protein JRN37_04180 [Nitrososphaerota archaeon]|jgi:hypothetical protein|nr:hypothetical protein [Nitrososphaerota archaeon]MDG7036245.1 hypothetical protein [Nitrososphaerota archaeon]MDG7038344.1 hypothetical protein [Nitrososphaerota archaeon]